MSCVIPACPSPPRPPQVIGRVAGLTSLNGAEVRPRERRDSELRYLQHVAAEMAAAAAAEQRAAASPSPEGGAGAGAEPGATRAAVRDAHPRLRYLMATYGSVL